MNYIFQEYCHKIYKIRNRYLKKPIWNKYDKSPFLHFTDLGGPLSLSLKYLYIFPTAYIID